MEIPPIIIFEVILAALTLFVVPAVVWIFRMMQESTKRQTIQTQDIKYLKEGRIQEKKDQEYMKQQIQELREELIKLITKLEKE